MPERYAIYYAPPADTLLWRRGCRWLGRDPETGRRAWPPRWLSRRRWHALVKEPALYGLHGTLKAPFRPAPGVTARDVKDHVTALARRFEPFVLPPLDLGPSYGHLALCACGPESGIDRLAHDCIHELDHLRAPEGDRDRRRWGRWARFTPRQRQLLRTLGYPYTAELFWFHITLTGRVQRFRRDGVAPALRRYFAPALRRDDIPVHEIAIFYQAHEKAYFELTCRIPLGERHG